MKAAEQLAYSPMRYASVILDVDSTLCSIEGIDWLAARRGKRIAAQVRELTSRAMDGEIPLENAYSERLAMIRPSADDIEALAEAYQLAVMPGAASTLAAMRNAGVKIVLMSGGLRQALLPLARWLDIPASDVHTVGLELDDAGSYDGYDCASPLVTQSGKCTVARTLGLPSPVLAVGDGATDLAMKPAVDAFFAFTGVVRRKTVVRAAMGEIRTFDELLTLVLP